MSFLASNEPYGRVDDGVGAGLIGGALVGGAAAGATHRWGQQGLSSLSSLNQNAALSRALRSEGDAERVQRIGNQHERVSRGIDKAGSLREKSFNGSGKRRLATYGGSVLAGGLIGMGVDAVN